MRLGANDPRNIDYTQAVDVVSANDGTYCPECHCDLGEGDCAMCMQFPQYLDDLELGDGILTQDSYNWGEQ